MLASANVIDYGQKLNEADWSVIANKKSCTLRQLIPLYGKVEFEQLYRDQAMHFRLYINHIPSLVTKAKLTSMPPKWNHVSLLRPLAKVELKPKQNTLTLKHRVSMQVISELEDGMFPTLSYKSWTDVRNDINVSISPINFREHLPKFLACITSLPLKPVVVVKPKSKSKPKPIKIVQIVEDNEPDTVYFGKKSAVLNAKAKRKLKLLVKNLNKIKKNKHVIVSGYSDDSGNKTQSTAISKQRALNVQSYLEKLGIPAKSLFTRYFGRDHAILTNKTAKGRAKNRRVHIDIIESKLSSER
ncbi:hypothetical protein MNBD_GAMMA22-2711 [hydrothermal vent metagenome]|uniref:OmpA-like domain-containing protein n=1 Tax=hydrothermal vent metagenome TaxID=652676 RepID=A0A3B0ZZN0_9ZZZZ